MNKATALATLLALITLTAIYFNPQTKVDEFAEWKTKFGQPYDQSEELYRKLIFEKNLRKIELHNADPTQTYKMGINQFSIYSDQEFKERFLSQIIIPQGQSEILVINEQKYSPPNGDIDWSAKGMVSRVKNQGQCGSCWSFAAVASCQSWSLMNQKSYDLSQQQLVDCSSSYGNKGCQGGWPSWALKYIKDNGIVTEIQYPYVASVGNCQQSGGSYKISSYTTVSSSCSAVSSSIATKPVAVTVDATNWSRYSSGVFNNCNTSLNHAVLLVGIVSGNWKIKNSWGASWGQSGYMRLSGGNTCGICQAGGSYPN